MRFDSTPITEEENTEKITQNIINQITSSDIVSTSITEKENTKKITQRIINQIASLDWFNPNYSRKDTENTELNQKKLP